MIKKYLYIIAFLFLLTPLFSLAQDNEFSDFEDDTEFTESTDEFSKKNESANNEFGSDEFGADEFGDDEFSSDEFSEFSETSNEELVNTERKTNWNRFYWAIAILFFTVLSGIFVKYNRTRNLKPLFLLASVVILGFYRGGPGIISSFQNTYLYIIGVNSVWPAIVLFLGVIVITYFYGKVFCGWVCYLGAIQEFIHISKFKVLQSEKAQIIMRRVRYVIFGLLIIQLSLTQSIEWCKMGPFKVIFNLFSPNITGYVLMVVLLVSSLFIHRPFCKMVCPAGLIFGWVTKIPGAAILGINDSCAGCKTCNTACEINAITRDGKTSKLDNQECIMCGSCMDDCKIKSINPLTNGKNHHGKITLKGFKKPSIK
ncbi:MAG: 4Fe-4S binding protein [Ichthyobacteriaceae bacterium]|nr:4Fe-4S binding protein [Ichthyobacteriaceae bacterium]